MEIKNRETQSQMNRIRTALRTIPLPEENELLYSYLVRTAYINFISMSDLISVYRATPSCGRRKHQEFGFDCCGDLVSLLQHMYVPPQQVLEWYRRMSLFHLTAPLTTAPLAARVLGRTGPTGQLDGLIGMTQRFIRTVRICPQCQERERRKTGHFWLHVEHQIRGVSVCREHHCPLVELPGFDSKYPERPGAWKNLHELTPVERSHDYAGFAYDFYKRQFDVNVTDINTAIKMRRDELGYSSKKLQHMQQDYTQSGLDAIVHIDMRKFHTICRMNTGFINEYEKYLAILQFLFGDVETLAKYLPAKKDTENFQNMLSAETYEIVGEIRSDIVLLQHMDCGQVFLSSEWRFLSGWRCPYCETRTENEMLTDIVRAVGKDEYTVSNYTRFDKSADFHHCMCGQSFKKTPASFVEGEHRCVCRKFRPESSIREEIESFSGFRLIQYTGTANKVTIRHDVCGNEFESSIGSWINSPRCRICEPAIVTEKSFRKGMADLTGNDYILIGPFQGNNRRTEIQHIKCKRILYISPLDFTLGRRCPCERPITNFADVQRIVALSSDDAYEVVSETAFRVYLIRDRETGETVELRKDMLFAELERPTPSKRLPKAKGKLVGMPVKKYQVFLDYLRSRYRPGEEIPTWARPEGFTVLQAASYRNRLLKIGFLEQVQQGWRLKKVSHGEDQYRKENS